MRKIRTAEKKAEMLEAIIGEIDGIYEEDYESGESALTREEPIPEFSTHIEQVD